MDGPGAARRLLLPRHAALDREVELEGAGAVAVAAVGARDPRRQPVAGELGDRSGRQVEDDRVGRAAARRSERTGRPVSILPPRSRTTAASASAIAPRAAPGDGPAEAVAGADQRHADRGAERAVQRAKAWAATPPNRARASGVAQRRARASPAPAPASPKPGQQERVAGQVQDRPQHVLGERVEGARSGPKARLQAPAVLAQAGRRVLDRAQHRGAAAAVERVGEIDLRPGPLEARGAQGRASERGRLDRERVGRRALVVDQAGQGQLGAAGAAADRLRRLDHGHRHPAAGQGRGAGEPVRAGADDDRLAHRQSARFAPARRTRYARWSLRTCDRERPPVEPGLARDHLGDVDRALLDQARRGVVDPVALAPAVRPAGTRASPPAARRARSGSAPGRRRAAARRGSGRRRSCSRARRRRPARPRARRRPRCPRPRAAQRVERPPVRVHRAEGEAFVEEHFDHLRLVELGQLLGDDRRRLDDLAVELLLRPAPLAEQPLAGRPVARVVAHRGQEGDQVGAEVAEHRDAHAGDGEDRDQQRVVEGRERTSP